MSISYLKRVLENKLEQYLKNFPVIGLTGPRQSGKSTLLKKTLPKYKYVTFDDPQNIDLFEDDPVGFINNYPDKVIFDEVQFVPKLFHYIKMAVDQDRQNYGKFILTGSSQFTLMQNISESLAGRIGLLSLLPLQYLEIPPILHAKSVFKGGYPELINRDYQQNELWFSSYIETYLAKDVRSLSQVGNLREFRQFIRLLAANIGHTLDLSSYSKNIGVSVPTIKRWTSILEASYIIFLLPAFYNNFGKRITKSPKIYFYDTGLVSYLTGIKTSELYNHGPMAGQLYENYIIIDILKKIKHGDIDAELFFLRTQDKSEIDLIIDHKTHQEFIEIKKSSTFNIKMAKTLKQYQNHLKSNQKNSYYIIYQGKSLDHGNIKAINYGEYLSDLHN